MAAQSKLELILEWKNRIKSGISTAKASVSKGIQEMKEKVSGFKQHSAQAFGALKEQVPFIGRFTELMKNPWVAGAAAVVAFTALLGAATLKAAAFNHEFLDIRQLNLDKSKSELASYKGQILDTAFSTGLAARDMAKAFYDIQSGTGLFGKDVATMAEQVGVFSKVTKADLGASVNSTIKAMKTFGFGVKDTTGYLESNARAVQVGITTFNELAQVQTEFAGSAKAAGQDYNTANKLFASFTASAKDSATAATLTKAAFEGITKKPTVDGLKKIGINLFDSEGKVRKLDGVIRELVPKLQTMSDEDFLTWRNAIGGPEGLQMLFNNLKNSGDDVLGTMDAFDRSAFSMGRAVKNASEDFALLRKEIGNKLEVLMIRLGDHLIPIATAGLQQFGKLLDWIGGKSGLEKTNDRFNALKNSITGLDKNIVPLIKQYDTLKAVTNPTTEQQQLLKDTIRDISIAMPQAITAFDQYGNAMDISSGKATKLVEAQRKLFAFTNKAAIRENETALQKLNKQYDEVFEKLNRRDANGNIVSKSHLTGRRQADGTFVKIGGERLSDNQIFELQGQLKTLKSSKDETSNFLKYLRGEPLTEDAPGATAGGTGTGGTGTPTPDGTSGFSPGSYEGSAGRVRNITITLEALHKGDNIISANQNGEALTMDDVERQMNEIFFRMLRNVETSAG
jgi:TP901 family phage tail tape measure protein